MNPLITQEQLRHVPGVREAEYRDAAWFSHVWKAHGRQGMHLRAFHYKLVSLGTVVMAAGVRPHTGRGRPAADSVLDAVCLPYENSGFCWNALQRAASVSRYFRLVDARDFEEHRSPEAMVNAPDVRETPTPEIVPPDIDRAAYDSPAAWGYTYDESDQPITVELLCEKSTMDDVLAPLCQELRINYQPLTGMFSITRAVEMMCRAQRSVVVLYVSDLDAAGCNMPEAFAAALEHYQPIYAAHISIRLQQIVLTEDQVLAYNLPRNVIDVEHESPYNKRFRLEHPLGPCELDSLEAIHPGELARIVRAAVAPCFDKTLSRRLRHAHVEAQRLVDTAWKKQTAWARPILLDIDTQQEVIAERRAAAIAPYELQIAKIEETIAAVEETFAAEETSLLDRRDDTVQQMLDQPFVVELPERPEPIVVETDADWLCDLEGISA